MTTSDVGSEFRKDAASGLTVIVAPGRSARPNSNHETGGSEEETPPCPFCPGNEGMTTSPVLELPDPADPSTWFVRVVPNLFPIVNQAPNGDGDRQHRLASGFHEVVVETPKHTQEMDVRPPEQLYLTLQAYRERLRSLAGEPGVRHVAIFKNKGRGAGNSLAHPHSQIVALNAVPEAVNRRMQRYRRYARDHGRCLLCEAIQRERQQVERVVFEHGGFVALAPYASEMGESILAPLEHVPDFATASDSDLRAFAGALRSLLARLNSALSDPDYNLVLETWPRLRRPDAALHWYMRVLPRLGVFGGFELSTGMVVSSLSPEDAAAMYREAAPSS